MSVSESDVLCEIFERLSAEDGLTINISEYELNQWPLNLITSLKECGVLKKTQPASSVICQGCEFECLMPVHVLTDTNQSPKVFIVCDKRNDINRVPVALSFLEQWQVSGDSIADLIAKLLEIKRANYNGSDKSRWEIGLFKGTKLSSHLILISDGQLKLSLAGHSLPLLQLLTFDKSKFIIDKKLLNRLVNKPIAAAGNSESAKQRRERLIKRVEELKLKGNKSFLKIAAEEENISVSRLKQIIDKKEPVQSKSW